MPLAMVRAIENATGMQDAGPHLGRRQWERDLARLLLEDTNGAGPVRVSIVETTITVDRSRRYFVEAYYRARLATNP